MIIVLYNYFWHFLGQATKKQELSWYRPWRRWWQRRLSLRQLPLAPVTPKLASYQLAVFSGYHLSSVKMSLYISITRQFCCTMMLFPLNKNTLNMKSRRPPPSWFIEKLLSQKFHSYSAVDSQGLYVIPRCIWKNQGVSWWNSNHGNAAQRVKSLVFSFLCT